MKLSDRRTILVKCVRRRTLPNGQRQSKVDARLYRMSDTQRGLFEEASCTLAISSQRGRAWAEDVVEQTIASMLGGKMPEPQAPPLLHRLRFVFPTLKPKEMAALPRSGCPEGWLTALVMPVKVGIEQWIARLDLSKEQAIAYNDAIAAVQGINRVCRDEAWLFVNNTVGALCCGMTSSREGPVIDDLAAVFPVLSVDEVSALPRATARDIEDMCYTTAPEEEA